MIRSKLFLKHYFVGVVTTIILIVLALLFTSWIEGQIRKNSIKGKGPFTSIVTFINAIDPEKRVVTLKQSLKDDPMGRDFPLIILDQNKELLFGSSEGRRKPPHERVEPSEMRVIPFKDLGKVGFSPERREQYLIQLAGTPIQYAFLDFGPPPPFMMMGKRLLPTFGALFLALFIGIAFSIFFVLSSLRRRAEMADHVIAELKGGNLKARFPITKLDEVGKAMVRFNQMADEIEKLVETLRETEQTRKNLLQELAHDLRTPIASLKNLQDTLLNRFDALSEEEKQRIIELSEQEIIYIESLVEDLLFLGKVSDPHYRKEIDIVDFKSLIFSEMESSKSRYSEIKSTINIRSAELKAKGDSKLFRRMIKNALDNAFSFAKSEVVITATETKDKKLQIIVEDDGPGLSPQEISDYGNKKFSRKMKDKGINRVSIGLGSVIIRSVVENYEGKLLIENGELGARVTITL